MKTKYPWDKYDEVFLIESNYDYGMCIVFSTFRMMDSYRNNQKDTDYMMIKSTKRKHNKLFELYLIVFSKEEKLTKKSIPLAFALSTSDDKNSYSFAFNTVENFLSDLTIKFNPSILISNCNSKLLSAVKHHRHFLSRDAYNKRLKTYTETYFPSPGPPK